MDAFFSIFLNFFLNLFSYIQKSLKFKKIKKDYQKKLVKDIKIFLKKKKKKSSNMVVNVTKISDEKSNLVEYRKKIL